MLDSKRKSKEAMIIMKNFFERVRNWILKENNESETSEIVSNNVFSDNRGGSKVWLPVTAAIVIIGIVLTICVRCCDACTCGACSSCLNCAGNSCTSCWYCTKGCLDL